MKISPPPNLSKSVVLYRGFTDVMKLFSAIMVAMGHYSSHALNYVENPILRFFVMNGGSIGVAIFFFLSGYGLMMSEMKKHLGLFAFMKRRLMKVYLPVVFVSAIWGIVKWPNGSGFEHLPDYAYTVFIGFGDGILWFIRVILVMYLMFFVYTRIRTNRYWRMPALIAGTVAAYVLVFLWQADWCAISIPIFTLGIVVAEYNEFVYRIARSWRIMIWLLLVSALMGMLFMHFGNLYAHAWINYVVITAVVVLCAYRTIKVDVPDWVGGVSYDVYLTHNKVINYCLPIYGYIGLTSFIIGTVITATASYSLRKMLRIQ